MPTEMHATLAEERNMDAQYLNFMACLVQITWLGFFSVHLQFRQLQLPCTGVEEHT